MLVFVSISSFVVAMVAVSCASCVPNPCQKRRHMQSPYHANDNVRFYCRCTFGWDGRFCTIPFRYIGYYADSKVRIMAVMLPLSRSNSPLECAARCYGYAYIGTQVGDECWCGDCMNAVRRPDSECNRACPVDSSKKCGADWRMSVYSNRAVAMSTHEKRKSWFGINAEPEGPSSLFEN